MKVRFASDVEKFIRSKQSEAKNNPENGFAQSLWRIVRGVCRCLADPEIARRPDRRLKHNLRDLWRVYLGKEYRFIYVINDKTDTVLVLAVGKRLKGTPEDVYWVMLEKLRAGDFDELLEAFGVPWEDPKV